MTIKTDIHRRYKIPTKVTTQIDTRENYPLVFPSMIKYPHPELQRGFVPIQVATEHTKLDVGDYRLKEYPNCGVVERKASQLELFKNLMEHHDSIRQAKAFRKLAAVEYPILLVEASPGELLQTRAAKPRIINPELVCGKLGHACAKYGFHLVMMPWKSRGVATRRKFGTFVLHLMLAFALNKTQDVIPRPLL
jgi:ERCC4-type nuclease